MLLPGFCKATHAQDFHSVPCCEPHWSFMWISSHLKLCRCAAAAKARYSLPSSPDIPPPSHVCSLSFAITHCNNAPCGFAHYFHLVSPVWTSLPKIPFMYVSTLRQLHPLQSNNAGFMLLMSKCAALSLSLVASELFFHLFFVPFLNHLSNVAAVKKEAHCQMLQWAEVHVSL